MELSTEQKAEAYDRALKKAKDALNDGTISSNTIAYFQDIFPELKESEDEKIRKQIISFLKEFEYDHYRNLDFSSWISWLEKQSEQKHSMEGTFVNVDEVREGFMQEVYRALYSDPTNDRANQIIDAFDHLPTITIQKPADKVEPKFKNGQWIVLQNKFYKVNDNGCGYELIDQNGLSTSLEYGTIDESARLWNIGKDAKAGDVLAFNDGHGKDCIELIKSITDKKIEFWFCLTNGNYYEVFDRIIPYTNLVSREGANPATKEQRDTLIQAMADAGYTFDFEKKELKKVEQKSAWSEEDEKNSLDIKCLIGSYRTGDTEYRLDSWIDSLKDRVQPKQEWSEEDEWERKRVVGLLKGWMSTYKETCYAEDCRCGIEWLKSIKERYTWKPSEEQMKALNYVVNLMASSKSPNENDYYYNVFKDLRKQLKKLRKE